MSSPSRRSFLSALGTLATAPVLTAMVPYGTGGLVAPSAEIAKPEPLPMVVSSLIAPTQAFQPGEIIPVPQGLLLVWIDGQPWHILAYRA